MKYSLKQVPYIVLGLLIMYGLYTMTRPYLTQGFANENGPKFNLYYAEWCPHCKTVKPAFESWMSSQTLVKAQMFEADKDSAEVKAANVKGFPTFQLVKEDGTVIECNERTPDGWNSFLKSNL